MHRVYTVYDFADRYPISGLMLVPLLFVVLGIGLYIFHKKFVDESETSMLGINKRKYGMVFGIIFSSLAGLFSIVIIPTMLVTYINTRSVYEKKRYQTVEGVVENYHPMPARGRDSETFDVNGVEFKFSDFDVSDYGYNNAASHGGVILPGLKVRIGYFNNGQKNVILKLEIE